MTNEVVEKPKRGRFLKGQSGNPAGRPKGSKNKITLMKLQLEGELRTQLAPHMAEILGTAIEKAKKCDKFYVKLLLDKVLASVKSAEDEDSGQEKVQIFIGRLPDRKDEPITINGEVIEDGN